jgi:hypothetical protein
MSDLYEIVINLLAAVLGGVIFALWRTVRIRLLFRGDRAFWQPFLTEPFHVVIAEFLSKEVKEFEMAGLTGLGEVHALVDLLSRFSNAQLPTGLNLKVPNESSSAILSDNLIILGGPDVNSAALKVKDAHISSVAVERDVMDQNFILDLETSKTYAPSKETKRVSGKNVDVVRDYGLIIRAKNPFNPKRNILVISGAYGYGVIAGVQVCLEKAAELHKMHPEGFEAIVKYSMTEGPPGITEIETMRPLTKPKS